MTMAAAWLSHEITGAPGLSGEVGALKLAPCALVRAQSTNSQAPRSRPVSSPTN
jgi:hypothetical protein